MRTRLLIIAVFAALAAARIATPAAAAERSCGTESVQNGGFSQSVQVSIALGSVPCKEARAVIKLDLSNRHVVLHGDPRGARSGVSWTLTDGWTCKGGAGGGACVLGGSGQLRSTRPRKTVVFMFA